jgi:hypothetical protein
MTQFEAYIEGFNKALSGDHTLINPYDDEMLAAAWATGFEQGVSSPDNGIALLDASAFANVYD